MIKCDTEFLGKLHDIAAKEMADRIKNGETVVTKKGEVVRVSCAPAVLSATVRLLVYNGIKAPNASMDDGAEIAAKVRSLVKDDEETTYGPN